VKVSFYRAYGRGIFSHNRKYVMGELYERIFDFENLYQAAELAAKGKKYRAGALRFFHQNLDESLIEIQNELIWKTYKLGNYYTFEVKEPKPRIISALPFRDRIIQIALCNIIEPVIDKRFIYDIYACRIGKGSIAAATRLSYFTGKPDAKKYLKCDVHKYFRSINIDRLEEILKARYINDPDVLWLINTILRHDYNSDGIKIGNRFSQLAANIYLAEMDFFLKVKRQEKYYIRYMDDFIILGNSKLKLHKTLNAIEEFLDTHLLLKLNDKTKIDNCKNGIDFVGYRIFPKNKIIKKSSMSRTLTVLRAWQNGKITDDRFLASIGSRTGHAKGTASYKFFVKILLKALQWALSINRKITRGGGIPLNEKPHEFKT
jgi:retron-type reverse transcriptase